MATLPGYIPGDQAHKYAAQLASKRGSIGYIPVSPSTEAKPEEAKKETAKPKKEK